MKHVNLRLDDGLHSWLVARAARQKRSINGHIEYLLEQDRATDPADKATRDQLRELVERAWNIIANAGWEDRGKPPDWPETAARWIDDHQAFVRAQNRQRLERERAENAGEE